MKNPLFSLLMIAGLGSLSAQYAPNEVAQIDFTLLHKTIAYNSIQLIDPGSSMVYEQMDFKWNNHRKLLEGRDSVDGSTTYTWQGNISGNSNQISVYDGSQLLMKDVIYWDSQYRDTLIVSYTDTNMDNVLDKTMGLRLYPGTQGDDSVAVFLYDQSGTFRAITYVTYRDVSGRPDSIVGYFDFFGFRFPGLVYNYQWSGSALSAVELHEPGSGVIFRLMVQNNASNQITSVTSQTYDSTSSQWINEETTSFKTQSFFGEEEIRGVSAVQFFPNPAHDWVNIRSEGATEVEIMSMDGRCVYKAKLSQAVEREEISHLPAGAYTIWFYSKDASRSYKLLKE